MMCVRPKKKKEKITELKIKSTITLAGASAAMDHSLGTFCWQEWFALNFTYSAVRVAVAVVRSRVFS